MLYKDKGIFLQKVNYSETSLIAKIYTEKFGLLSFLLKGARRKNSKMPANLLQHLALLNMELYYRENANLQKIKELSVRRHLNDIPYNIRKSTIAMFMNEVLQKSIKEQESNPPLFHFIENSITYLDDTKGKVMNFHLIFLIQLTRYLGFYPNNNYSEQTPYFDMMEGGFYSTLNHTYSLDEHLSKILSSLLNLSFDTMNEVAFRHHQHTLILEKLIDYYSLHIPGFTKVKSLSVLREVFA